MTTKNSLIGGKYCNVINEIHKKISIFKLHKDSETLNYRKKFCRGDIISPKLLAPVHWEERGLNINEESLTLNLKWYDFHIRDTYN